MERFDIYFAEHRWRGSGDVRPFLLVTPLPFGAWHCFAVSSHDYDSDPFEVSSNDSDFAATGLAHTSYIYDIRKEEVAAGEFRWRL